MNNKLRAILTILKESTKAQIITGLTTVALIGGISYTVFVNSDKTDEYVSKTEVSVQTDDKEEVAQVEKEQTQDKDTNKNDNNNSSNGSSSTNNPSTNKPNGNNDGGVNNNNGEEKPKQIGRASCRERV